VLTLLFASCHAWAADILPPPKGLKAAPVTALSVPQNVLVAATPDGPQIAWQPLDQATSYQILRGTSAAPVAPAIATLPKGTKTYLDKGFTGNASYQVVAVAADGRVGASAVVSYSAGPAKPVAPVLSAAKPMAQAALLRPPVALVAAAAPTAVPPVVSSTVPLAAPTGTTSTTNAGPVKATALPALGGAVVGAGALRADGPVAFARLPLVVTHGQEMRNAKRSDLSGQFVKAGSAIPFKPFQLDEIFDLKTGKALIPLALPAAATAGVKVTPSTSQDLTAMAQRRGIKDFSVGSGGSFELKSDAQPFGLTSRLVLPRRDGTSITLPAVYFLQELNAMERGLNAQGISLRDRSTGKLAAGGHEVTVQKLNIDRSRVDRQRQEMNNKFIRNITVKPWDAGEVVKRYREASARVAPLRAVKGGRLVGAVVSGAKPAMAQRSPGVASIAGTGRVPARGGMAAIKNATTCPEVFATQSGAMPGESVTFKVAAFDASKCVLAFKDKTGAVVDQPNAVYSASPGALQAPVPANLSAGPASVYMRAKASGWDGAAAAYYVGALCSLDTVYPAIGMPGMKVDISGGRLDSGACEVYLVDKLNFETKATLSSTVELLEGAVAGSKNPNDYRLRYTLDVPEFTLGKVRVQSRTVKNATMVTAGRLDALAHGTATGSSVIAAQSSVVSAVDFKIVPAASDGNGNAPPPDYFSRDLKPFWRELKPFNQLVGDPNNIAAGVDAQFKIFTRGKDDDNLVRFEGDAAVHGYLLANATEIIGAHATASMPTARTEKDNKFRANFSISVEEKSVYTWNKVKLAEAGESGEADVCNASEKDVLGNCCDNIGTDGLCTAGVGVTVGYQFEKEFKQQVDEFVEFYFDSGILPIVGRLGFRGDIGTKLHFAASPLQLIGRVTPFVHTSAYAECAVDVLVAQAGVGANLVLADVTLDAAGAAYLDFGQMAIKTDFYVYLDYNFLDGSVYVFVDTFKGDKLKWTLFDINDLVAQNTSLDLSKFKGKVYLEPPGSYPVSLLP
jgi:hypothetical protein